MQPINTQPRNMHPRKPRHLPTRSPRATPGIQPPHPGPKPHHQGQEMLVSGLGLRDGFARVREGAEVEVGAPARFEVVGCEVVIAGGGRVAGLAWGVRWGGGDGGRWWE